MAFVHMRSSFILIHLVAFLPSKISKNYQMEKFGTEGKESDQKTRKLSTFRKENHSTENPGKFLGENQTERKISVINFQKIGFTSKLSFNPKNFRKCCNTGHWQSFSSNEECREFFENWHQGIAKQSKFHCLGFDFDFAYVAQIM